MSSDTQFPSRPCSLRATASNSSQQPADFACTSLIYRDASDAIYLGRTLELTMALPYQVAYLPAGQKFTSQVNGQPPADYQTRLAILSVVMADRMPSGDRPLSVVDLKIMEGVNEAGLTFSLLAYPTVSGVAATLAAGQPVLAATDLGTWSLGQFQSVAEVKSALQDQPVALDRIGLLGGAEAPFHYVLHDRSGDSVVLEFDHGELSIYDNPVGVMTNGPQFSWHLTNLNNYTFLNPVDQSSATFGKLRVQQPDSGIATSNLPASNTSVGRFVRAVYYSQFAEKVADPDQAVRTLAHIMNNFDRPKGITISPRAAGGHMEVQGLSDGGSEYATEYTSWTNLTDLNRCRFFLRTYDGLNYTMFDLVKLARTNSVKILPLAALDGMAPDGTERLLTR